MPMPTTTRTFDVVVIGGGHAGCEAAAAAARLGADTLLLTINIDHLAQMSCNPAIGGIAKGQVVREVDALGGLMGQVADAACIQFRILNRSKGPAVRSPRTQCDKLVYQRRMQQILERTPNLCIHQAQAVGFETTGDRVSAVRTDLGDRVAARAFVLTPGTFPGGTLHYGTKSVRGGRAGDPAALALSQSLTDDLRLTLARLKTGTPPRVPGRTIDFDALTLQAPDEERLRFSFRATADGPTLIGGKLPQVPCYLGESTAETAELVRTNLDKAPLYAGRIAGVGTRYCPSFEDKIVKFPHRPTHTIYVEPEGLYTEEYYLNGISTSLPPEVQISMVRTLPGFERAELSRYAYAIEYDFVLPHQLDNTLALHRWPNLFHAGQINGTSGYEEAAGQGLIAGANAAKLAANSAKRLVLGRDQAYIGVLIDDLVTKEITEPYRLFTSRAEHRLLLRQDNADLRLVPPAYEFGLTSRAEYDRVHALETNICELRNRLRGERRDGVLLWDWLKRDGGEEHVRGAFAGFAERAIEQAVIEARYEGYIERERERARSLDSLADWHIPTGFEYGAVNGLRNEARGKLDKLRPDTLAQAARIDGVTPAEVALLQVHLKRLETPAKDAR